jgi:prepilin-type N-terminal cleavage/methylation domain-containing protein
MADIKLAKRGFTLIETIIAITIFAILCFALVNVYLKYYNAYHTQQAIISVAGSASTVANELQNATLQAKQVIISHTFSSGTYNSNQNTLVLQMPSIDSSGNILTDKYDYVVFYASGANFYRLVEIDGSSSRNAGLKKLSDTVSVIEFFYNDSDLSKVNEITVDINMQKISGHQTFPYSLDQKLYLRNS